MDGLYAEAGVKRENTPKTMMIRVGLIMLIIVLILFSLLTANQIFMFIGVTVIVLTIYFMPRLNIEYEYVFCDGQVDFDKIMGGAKRKTALKIDFEQVEIMAPMGSHQLDSYQQRQLKTYNFTSMKKDIKPYVIIAHSTKGEKGDIKILFEPTEKMIGCMKQKAPRKVVNY